MPADRSTDDLTIRPLTPDTWRAFADLVERHNGVFGGGRWCTYFHSVPSRDKDRTYESNRDLKCQLVEQGRAHAALVFDGDEAVAWAEFGPPEELLDLHQPLPKEYEASLVAAPDYRITCIFVDRRYRRGGVAALALRRSAGADLPGGWRGGRGIPARHVEAARRQENVAPHFLDNGTRRMDEEAGFTFQRSKGQKNCATIRTIAPA